MNDLLQQAKFYAQKIKLFLVENADWIGSLDSLVALLGVLISLVAGVAFWRWKSQGADHPGNSFGGGDGGTIVQGPVVQIGPGGSSVIHARDPQDRAVIDALLHQNRKLISQVDGLQEQIEKAVTGLGGTGEEQDVTEVEINRAKVALTEGNTALAEDIYQKRLHRQEAQTKASGKKQAETHRNLGALVFLHDTRLALEQYRKATVLNADEPEGWNQLGHLLCRTGDLSGARSAYQEVLRLASNSDDGQVLKAVAYGNLGIVHQTRGELDQAVEMYQKALELDAELSHKEFMANAYGNLGTVFQIRGELDQAVEMHQKALELDAELGDKQGIARDYINLGIVHQIRGELDQAVEVYEKAIGLNIELGNKQGIASGYGNLGNVHRVRGDLDQAVEMYEKALGLNIELGHKQDMASAYGHLGIVHHIRNELDQAQECWVRSADLLNQIKSPQEATVRGWIESLNSASTDG